MVLTELLKRYRLQVIPATNLKKLLEISTSKKEIPYIIETNVFKKIAMYTILSNDNMLEDIIRYINSNLHIIDNKGQELIYERVDEKSLNFLQMPK